MRCWHAEAPMSLSDKLRGMSVVVRSVDRRVVTTRLNATTGLRHKVPSFSVVEKRAKDATPGRGLGFADHRCATVPGRLAANRVQSRPWMVSSGPQPASTAPRTSVGAFMLTFVKIGRGGTGRNSGGMGGL